MIEHKRFEYISGNLLHQGEVNMWAARVLARDLDIHTDAWGWGWGWG